MIWKIRRQHDASILLCTHDMGEAEELCDRIGIMVDGELIALDTADGLKQRYRSETELPTLEDVFMAATGKTLEESVFEEEDKEMVSA